jgi:hypothetical protein
VFFSEFSLLLLHNFYKQFLTSFLMTPNPERIQLPKRIKFLEELGYHPAMFVRDPGTDVPDIVKAVHDLADVLRCDPSQFNPKLLTAIADAEGCQHGKAHEVFIPHSVRVGSLSGSLASQLLDRHPMLNLAPPGHIKGVGGAHDNGLWSPYSKDPKGPKQYHKELSWVIQANELGVPWIANHGTNHATYDEALDIMAAGDHPQAELYAGWRAVLNNPEHPYCLPKWREHFADYLTAKGNLTLMVVAQADMIENGQNDFDPETYDLMFWARNAELMERYDLHRRITGKPPMLFGPSYTLNNAAGLFRVVAQKHLITSLLTGTESDFKPGGKFAMYGPDARPGLWGGFKGPDPLMPLE